MAQLAVGETVGLILSDDITLPGVCEVKFCQHVHAAIYTALFMSVHVISYLCFL